MSRSGLGLSSNSATDNFSMSWNRFWFQPRSAETLAMIRILAGAMLVYTHLIWAVSTSAFVGEEALLPIGYRDSLFGAGHGAWSLFDWVPFSAFPIVHGIAILTFVSFTIGFRTRVAGILSWIFVVSYANRTIGAQFGLDQVNCFLTAYLALSHCGAHYSLDAWLARRKTGASGPGISEWNTVATRLIQFHLCVVYLFAAIGKLQGAAWLNGEAILMAFSSLEYQTLDMTWLVHHMWLINLLTLVSLAWELAYPALVWIRWTRPFMLLLAVMVHLGIGFCMGMLTFGFIMIVANMAFITPFEMRSLVARIFRVQQAQTS